MTMTDLAPYVLVKAAVVYKLIRPERARQEYRYRRYSVPPDAVPGKASKFKPSYAPGKLPEHEAIDQAEATRILDASVTEFEKRLAAMKDT